MADIPEVTRGELAELIATGAVTVVEALPEHVYAQGHLPGAVNIRPRRVAELAPTVLPNQHARIVVYCGSAACDASLRVAHHLFELGYTNVARYTAGKHDWTAAGLPLHTGGDGTGGSIALDLLALNLTTCQPCLATAASLDTAVAAVAPALGAAGIGLAVRRITVTTTDQAHQLRLVASPTIRVSGHDIAGGPGQAAEQAACDSDACTTPAGEHIDCRVWTYRGQRHTAAPVGLLVEAILTAAADPTYVADRAELLAAPVSEPFHLSDNLRAYFTAPTNQPLEDPMTTNSTPTVTPAAAPSTGTVPAGGFIGDPAEAFNPPATDGGCCGSPATAGTAAEAGGCCGSTSDSAQESSAGCCG